VEEVRRARFLGGAVRNSAGEWRPLTEAKFTASRAAWEARDNINAGVESGSFFLATGGETRRGPELSTLLVEPAAGGTGPADLPAAVWASTAEAKPR
jgi:hypothetical protein